MTQRTARWIAWSTAALFLILSSIGVALQAETGRTTFNLGLLFAVGITVVCASWLITGSVIVSKLPRNPVGWLLMLCVATWGPQMLSFGLVANSLEGGFRLFPGYSLAMLWLAWTGQPFTILGLTLLFLLFPEGRLVSRGWGRVAWAALLGMTGYLVLQPLRSGVVDPAIGLASPFALTPDRWPLLEPINLLALGLSLFCLFAAALSLIVRFRRSTGVGRLQLKWFAYSAVPVILTFASDAFINPEDINPLTIVSILLGALSLLGMAIAVAFSVLRYRLYDIDVIIHRSLVYGGLTVALTLLYLSAVVVIQGLTRRVTGQESPVALVASTLLVAAAFEPLRHRTQEFIDRRFYRKKYDAEKALARFSAALRGEADPETISMNLLAAVEETLQPEGVSLWLSPRP